MCSKPAKFPGVEVQPNKLAKTRTRLLKENNTVQHASTDQSAAKRTRYTSTTGTSKISSLKAPKELNDHTKIDCLPRALSNETINIPKGGRNAPIKQVHKSSETLTLLKRPHFVRAVSNEEAQPQSTAPSRRRLPQTKLEENLVHAVSNETLRGPIHRYLHQSASNTVHGSTETLNLLKRPHCTRVVSTEESHMLTASNGHSTTLINVTSDTFHCDPPMVEHMSPYVNELPSKSACVLPFNTHTDQNGMLDEELPPVTTILASTTNCQIPPISPPINSGKQGFFQKLIKTESASILTSSPHTSQLPPPALPIPCSSSQPELNCSPLKFRDSNKSAGCSNNIQQSLIKTKNAKQLTNFNSRFPGEVPLDKTVESTIPATLATKVSAPHFSTESQRPNLLSLNSACFSDQQQISTSGMICTKWSLDHEMFTSERDKLEVVTYNHIGQKVVVSGEKVGVLKYFGGIEFESGNWCGIELDEPAGLNDGSIKGVRYFKCKPGHGILAPQTKVQLYRPIIPKQLYCDMLPSLIDPSPSILLGTKNSMCIESFEKSQPKSTATPSTTANTNQVWETNAVSPKPAQQVNISKQNSFELDESLGILTPDQLPDQLVSLSTSVDSFLLNQPFSDALPPMLKDAIEPDVLCESDGSEDLLSRAVLSKSDPKNVDVSDRTLSPEDLPMDPPGQCHAPPGGEEVKEVRSPGPSSKSQPPPTSFVTSITSIGSLDTDGYQGDGELSRPASRNNNCTSPTGLLPHKACVLKMKTSAQDPMTDSDFFTESDADDLAGPGKGGDRHAQVIDGTLYNNNTNNSNNGGCLNQQHQRCPSFTASINEEMESSGVYSDLERKPEENQRQNNNEEKPGTVVFSPDLSTNTDSTKSEHSQVKDLVPLGFTSLTPSRQEDTLDATLTAEQAADPMEVVVVNENKEFEGTPSIISNTSSQGMNDSKSSKKSVELKKYKMPKRNVVSKIKAMIEASPTNRGGNASTEEENHDTSARLSTPKAARKGRWDAVMSKIAQGQADEKMKPARLKEVKSKVFANLADGPPITTTPAKRKLPGQSPSAKKENQTPLKTKSRRGRTRASSSSSLPPGPPQTQADSGAGGSPNSSQRSSLSDLAAAPVTKPQRPSKKVLPARSTSPSPASDLSAHSGQPRGHPTPTHAATRVASVEMKTPPARKPALRRGEKHKILRDHNRLAACVPPKQPPAVEPPPAPHVATTAEATQLRHAAKSVQALAIMVQYLVHEVDAFATPHLKERLSHMTAAWQAATLERDELLAGNARLQDDMQKINISLQEQLEGLGRKHQEDLNKVVQDCEEELVQRATTHEAQLEAAAEEHRLACEKLRADFEQLLATSQATLQEEHQAAMKRLQLEHEERLARLQASYDTIEADHMKGKQQYRAVLESMKLDKDSRLQTTASQCKDLQDEVHSLRTVLGLRQEELQDLRVKNAILEREKEDHQAEINRNSLLQARIEDLEAQLEKKSDKERRLAIANHRLSESFQQESFTSKRLSQHNEELMWKLKTQSEICSQLASGNTSDVDVMNISAFIGSCNTSVEPHCAGDCSALESPIHVTNYYRRSDSVAWTLDMVDAGKSGARTGGAVRRIRSFHDTNSPGYPDLMTSPQHAKSAVCEKIRSVLETGNGMSTTSTPLRSDLKKQLNHSSESALVNLVESDQNEQLVGLQTLLVEKGSCSNLAMQVASVPKDAAGEAMISEETSEEDDSSEQNLTDEESSSEVMLS